MFIPDLFIYSRSILPFVLYRGTKVLELRFCALCETADYVQCERFMIRSSEGMPYVSLCVQCCSLWCCVLTCIVVYCYCVHTCVLTRARDLCVLLCVLRSDAQLAFSTLCWYCLHVSFETLSWSNQQP